ncbi:MAG TPA: M42 family peptidase [Solirubrobacteraceae bacterium]|jgi:putative aminopeptidase FrvX|nr:M42 family peptidase [Solirubrobacteraceae bacterium]
MASVPALLDALLRAAGPSGHETAPAKVWRDSVAAFSDDVRADRVGSSVVRVPRAGAQDSPAGPSLAVIGHIDEIGVHVTHIEDSGMLRFGEVGGWDPIQLVGQRIVLTTRDGELRGVIGRKPIHLIRGEDRDKAPKVKDLHIDVGAANGDEARTSVRVGDVGVIDSEPLRLRNDRLVSRSLDNRIGSYVAAETARLVAEAGGAPGDVFGLAVAQEETTFAGARTSAFGLHPDVAVVVDVTHATDQPGVELGPDTSHELGSGPVIARGTSLHPAVTELLLATAESEGIAHTVESVGRQTGTDADAVHASRTGVPTAVVSIPLRYMHSSVELVALSDVEATARLLAAFARRLGPELVLER